LKVDKKRQAVVAVDMIISFNLTRKEIITGMIPKSFEKCSCFKAVLESNASENGARMTAMDKATEKCR